MICKTCGKDREAKHFSVHKHCVGGYDTSRCKPCKKAAYDWTQQPYENRMLNRTKARAKKKGLEFNLELSDIVFPEVCPVFKKPFIYGDKDWSWSIDRIDHRKVYIKGNVMVMSNRANRLKNNATAEELEQIVHFLRACEIGDFV